MKELLLLSANNVHFTLFDSVQLQNHGIEMGFPLDPILAGIITVELETKAALTMSNYFVNLETFC